MPTSDVHKPRVLIVDDEAPIRVFAERALRSAGYDTRVATDGKEALRVTDEDGPFDLLLTDLAMPGMFGDELARRVRLEHPDQRVLYLTGFSDRLFNSRQALWAHEAVIEKPATVDSLREAVSRMLFGHTHGLPGVATA
jgi:two-component system cell cycle sensor histidine kinase/response regulator CckA